MRSGRRATSSSTITAAMRNRPAPTVTAGNAPTMKPFGQVTVARRRSSIGDHDRAQVELARPGRTIVESQTHWRSTAMPSSRRRLAWLTSAHGL